MSASTGDLATVEQVRQTAVEGILARMDSNPGATQIPYWLYLLECEGGSYYAGIAIDVEERFTRHVLGRGARYTRANPPLRVAAARQYPNKGLALSAEHALKQLPRVEKLNFFA